MSKFVALVHHDFANHTRLAAYALGLAVLCLMPGLNAKADELKLATELSLMEAFDDNILFDPSMDNQIHDLVRRAQAGLNLDHRTPWMSNHVDGFLKQLRYRDNGELDALDYQTHLNVDYGYSQRLQTNLSAGYVKDSEVGRELDAISGMILAPSTRRSTNAQTGMQYALTPAVSSDLNFQYQDIDYVDNTSVGSRMNGLTSGINWQASPRATVGLYGAYSQYDYTQGTLNTSTYTTVQGVALWKVTQLLQLSLNVGGSLTRSNYEKTVYARDYFIDNGMLYYTIVPLYVTDENTSSHATVGSLKLSYTGYTWNIGGYLEHVIDLSSGLSTVTERSTAGLSGQIRFSTKLNADMQGSYNRNRSLHDEEGSQPVNEDSYHAQVGLHYNLTDNGHGILDHVTLNLMHSYSYLKDNETLEIYRRHYTGLSVIVAFPVYE